MDKTKKKRKIRLAVPLFAMISFVFLLLTGCHHGNRKESPLLSSQKGQEEVEAKPDSLKDDSMKAFYRLIPRGERIHGGMGLSESDK